VAKYRIVREEGSHLKDVHFIIQRQHKFLFWKWWWNEFENRGDMSFILGYDSLEDAENKLKELRNTYTSKVVVE